MSRSQKYVAVVLACAVPLSACTTTHFYGEYHPLGSAEASASSSAKATGRTGEQSVKDIFGAQEQQPVLATGSSWQFLWGTLNTGSVEVDNLLSSSFKDKTITDMSVMDHISLIGVVFWVLTVGIFSHHSIIVRGDLVETPGTPHETTPAPTPSTNPENP
jgi:hypothetical protein